jgi:hypothetical protein
MVARRQPAWGNQLAEVEVFGRLIPIITAVGY